MKVGIYLTKALTGAGRPDWFKLQMETSMGQRRSAVRITTVQSSGCLRKA
jgi:hypothetical protein